ncbi:hypothetical protein FPCIR_6916 [Fusarium pseudocircinatum]|uniref:Uncharacterized protein n=1 Tax=Fusarium pseudocircinatum TaxID=56676 RepID=A0A8H5LDM4_9HYPO|nr:hypothetical protein FPCIR_6916 [Fusarium pseudocircinatum]
MANNAGSNNIDNALHLLSVSLNNAPDVVSIPKQRLDQRNVVYSWTDDNKEDFEVEPVLNTNAVDNITLHKKSHYQEPPYIPGEDRRVPFLQKHPVHPFAVVLQAMKASNPDWRCDDVDIIVQSDLLNLIFSWIRGDHNSSFVIDASLVKNTLFITLFKGKKTSAFMPPTSVGQHHILEYPLGGLNLLVTSPGHLIRSVRGGEVCFARRLLTNDRHEPDWSHALPLLWFSGIRTGICGSVSDGVFKEDSQWYVNTKIRKWERLPDTRKYMRTMFWLLSYIRMITMEQLVSRSCSIHFEGSGSHKRLEFYAASRVQQLPTLYGEFWDEK